MAQGLVRYQQSGDLHFVTFSCYRRRAYLDSAAARNLFRRSLETMRARYDLFITGYVAMPEHVHLQHHRAGVEALDFPKRKIRADESLPPHDPSPAYTPQSCYSRHACAGNAPHAQSS
jgi:REP element-mobilizing transposase RayT